MTPIEFTVLGRPQPGGSKRAFVIAGRARLTEDNKRSRPWQALVRDAAHQALNGNGPLDGPLYLEVIFYMARPAAHYGTGRNANTIRPAAPRYPAVRPDTTKLLRGLEDALKGLAWRDDAQVVDQVACKRYGHPERADVLIMPAANQLNA